MALSGTCVSTYLECEVEVGEVWIRGRLEHVSLKVHIRYFLYLEYLLFVNLL